MIGNRRNLSRRLKRTHNAFIAEQNSTSKIRNYEERTKNLRRKIVEMTRKEPGSKNLERAIPRIVNIIFGLIEDAKPLSAKEIGIYEEVLLINEAAISIVERNIRTFHNRKVRNNRVGEAFLGAYLNCFFTFSVHKINVYFGSHPIYLWREEDKGNKLEIDVSVEHFDLDFEFQGEHHFTDLKKQRVDQFKLSRAKSSDKILIPVSMWQLNSSRLSNAIANRLTEYVGVSKKLNDEELWGDTNIRFEKLEIYSKAIQRLYLAIKVLKPTLEWLDKKTNSYIDERKRDGNIHTTSLIAPGSTPEICNIPLEKIYNNLGYVQRIRRQCTA